MTTWEDGSSTARPASTLEAFKVIHASGGDDTTAINAAITALASTGGKIIMPSALYQATTISIPASAKPVMLVGAGIDATTIREYTSAVSSSVDLIDVNASGGKLYLRDMTLQGPTSVSGANVFNLIHQGAGTGGVIDCENVRLYKFGYGIWSENSVIRMRDFIIDGGSSGTALGSSVGGQGILHAPTAIGQLDLDRGEITNCGHVSSNLYHGLYVEPIVDSNVSRVRFTNLYGTGFHTQHYGVTTPGDYVNYRDCYFGPAITALVGAAFSLPATMACRITDCIFEMQDNAIITGANGFNARITRCSFLGSSGGNQQIAIVNTGGKLTVDDCEFLGIPPSQIYCNANGNSMIITDTRFAGASTNDVELDTSLTTTEVLASGNRHTGASGSCFKLASGKRVAVRDCTFTGTVSVACVNNLSGSTLDTLTIIGNEFSQSGASVTLTTAPASYHKNGNFGSVGLSDDASYVEQTSDVSVTATSAATANTVVTAAAVTANGTDAYWIEFECAEAQPAQTAGATIIFVIYDGASVIANSQLAVVAAYSATGAGGAPVSRKRKLTPSAASHTYSVRAYVSTGTGTVRAASGTYMPAHIRITKA